MKRTSLNFPLMLSFNELAWIAAFALLILYAATVHRNHAAKARASTASVVPRPVVSQQTLVNRDLLGLKGQLDNVAIIIDRSGSMRKHWSKVQRTVRIWLENLPIKRCAIIMFSESVRQYPPGGGFLNVQGDSGNTNREALVKEFETVNPAGNTNTLLALETAYSYDHIDTIILFTDGFPDSGSHRFDKRLVERIYRVVRQHRSIVINTIGVGRYFDRRFREFLFRLPHETGGSFLGL